MSTPTPSAPTNQLGFTRQDYVGSKSTLCAGCGHDAITAQIISAAFESNIEGYRVAKLSGIGCSSKTPTYFLSQGWGFNSVHGRMPAVATGAALANRSLINIGVSGDGDSMSIGTGQFVHAIRRNLPMIYVIEDNGVYGLTKGQFSATADKGSSLKSGATNHLTPIDPCTLAIELGCGFVARCFSGNPKQMNAIFKAAFAYNGLALIDIISPCVTFNNHDASTRSYKHVKDHDFPLHDLGFIQYSEVEEVDIAPGTTEVVTFPDGSKIAIKAIHEGYEPTDRFGAMKTIHESMGNGEFLTGLLYINPDQPTLPEILDLIDEPLVHLDEKTLKPKPATLDKIMQELM
ncbi:MAG TPA: 2-oxoacid:ferredoxin oxidoreductase subunit beta [Geothrix sp.]|nr:2-oxoacid:ferredoxin oxidoreductase subunit beta [Geothrix sp.]